MDKKHEKIVCDTLDGLSGRSRKIVTELELMSSTSRSFASEYANIGDYRAANVCMTISDMATTLAAVIDGFQLFGRDLLDESAKEFPQPGPPA